MKKIINMRKYFFILGFWSKVVKVGNYFIKEVYKFFIGVYDKVYQKFVVSGKKVSFGIVFIVWVVLNGKFFIKERVIMWNNSID